MGELLTGYAILVLIGVLWNLNDRISALEDQQK